MKKIMIVALAFVASASLSQVDAAKKKNKIVVFPAPVEEPVTLNNGSDSVSYATGISLTNGLIPFLINQQHVDTAYMADFIQAFREVVKTADDPRMKARVAGMEIATQVRERMIPSLKNEYTDTPDSLVEKLLYRGFIDALQKDTTFFTQVNAEKYAKDRMEYNKAAKDEKLYGPIRDAGKLFLEENAKKDSVITLPSGLQYKVLVKGEGEVPSKDDKVLVNYEGRLIDGTVFDASAKHGDKPAEFTPGQVIRGWTEALTMMPVGSKWQLYIPYELAYGERGAGEDIKPYSTLIFDVELVGIDRPKAEEPAEPEKPTKKGKKAKK